jgi:hypothetical protein
MISVFCCTLFLLPQPVDTLRFRKTTQGSIVIAARLSDAQSTRFSKMDWTQDTGEEWLRVRLIDLQTKAPGPPMLGNYECRKQELVFRPRFPLEAGKSYRAFFGNASGPVVTADYKVPVPKLGPPPRVVKVYPTADVLPANVLRFVIYFSQPMRGGEEIFDQIRILGPDGKQIDEPWLLDEIWDEDGKCLIIYIHPGRIKWGVELRELMGPVCYPNKEYSLVVGGAMCDAAGQKLGKDFVKKFRTTDEDRVRVDLGAWKIQAPAAGSRQPVVVAVGKSIDHKSFQRFLTVRDAKGHPVAGTGSVGMDDKSWAFVPERAWQKGEYRIDVGGRLEDVAGNTPLRPFDLDLKAPPLPTQRMSLSFHAR